MREEIILTENRGQIINDWLKSEKYELYHNEQLIEKDIEIQNLKAGTKLVKIYY